MVFDSEVSNRVVVEYSRQPLNIQKTANLVSMVVKAHCLTSTINQNNSNHGWATFQTTAFSSSTYEYANLKHIAR